jgi:sigma-E factor negative regulatory protein RseA
MSKESLEHLSSLMDGELSREAALFLTRRLFTDESMCEKWERYHLIRDCIRQPGSKQVVTGLSDRLSATLDAEDTPTASVWRQSRWLKPVSGLAIAASVALLAIMVTAPQPGQKPVDAGMALSMPVNKPFVSPNTLAASPASQAVTYSPAQQANANRMNAYLLRHNQMARTAGRQGFVSFVPIVATTTGPAAEDAKVRSESVKVLTALEKTKNK